jgi:hypothetical protein
MGNRFYAGKPAFHNRKAINILLFTIAVEMKTQDLTMAKERLLAEKSLTLSIVNNGQVIFETASHGISGFLEAIEKFGERGLEGASVADRITGKAIALLCIYSKVKAVYAVILSKGAKDLFEKHAVHHEWSNLVEKILDIDKAEVCPFEKLAAKISNPKEAYKMLKALQNSLNKQMKANER